MDKNEDKAKCQGQLEVRASQREAKAGMKYWCNETKELNEEVNKNREPCNTMPCSKYPAASEQRQYLFQGWGEGRLLQVELGHTLQGYSEDEGGFQLSWFTVRAFA